MKINDIAMLILAVAVVSGIVWFLNNVIMYNQIILGG